MSRNVLPKVSNNMKSSPNEGKTVSGNVMKQATQSKDLSYDDGRTTSGNTMNQAKGTIAGSKLYSDTPSGPEGYSLGSLTKKTVH